MVNYVNFHPLGE
jgi:WD40 repeat protein